VRPSSRWRSGSGTRKRSVASATSIRRSDAMEGATIATFNRGPRALDIARRPLPTRRRSSRSSGACARRRSASAFPYNRRGTVHRSQSVATSFARKASRRSPARRNIDDIRSQTCCTAHHPLDVPAGDHDIRFASTGRLRSIIAMSQPQHRRAHRRRPAVSGRGDDCHVARRSCCSRRESRALLRRRRPDRVRPSTPADQASARVQDDHDRKGP
jgi:hypothetical protein